MPSIRLVSDRALSPAPLGAPRDASAPSFPYTCAADEDPTRPLPKEHDANGHYAIGPKLAQPALASLIREETDAPPAPSPDVAHAQQRLKRDRARQSLKKRERLIAAAQGYTVGRNPRTSGKTTRSGAGSTGAGGSSGQQAA